MNPFIFVFLLESKIISEKNKASLRCVKSIFSKKTHMHCAYSCTVPTPTDKNSGNESKNKFKTKYFSVFLCFFIIFSNFCKDNWVKNDN
jgi:hypothetical protein